MAWFDWMALAVIGISVLLGLWRGLITELLLLSAWVAAFIAAQAFAVDVAAALPLGSAEAPWRYAAGFLLVFIVVVFATGLLAALGRKLMAASGVRPIDRTLGALFGATRGLVALLVVAVMVHLMALSESAWWRESRASVWLDLALHALKPTLPEKLASFFP